MTKADMDTLGHELMFWRDFVQAPRFLLGWLSETPTPELDRSIVKFIQEHRTPGGRVLDLGSGVASILLGTVPQAYLTSADLLAPLYACIFDYSKHHVKPPLSMAAEDVTEVNAYRIVHIRNALDHCYSPAKAMEALWRAVEPGGFLIVAGFENEGTFEQGSGMHQWNLALSDGGLRIRHVDGFTGKASFHRPGATIRATTEVLPETGKKWLTWIQQKGE